MLIIGRYGPPRDVISRDFPRKHVVKNSLKKGLIVALSKG